MKTFGKILKIVAVCIAAVFISGVTLSPPLGKPGKPSTADLVRAGCGAYVRYATFAATNGEFRFVQASFLQFATTNFQFSQVGNAVHSTGGVTKGVDFEAATRHAELYDSKRAIFNTNQDFWARTSFSLKAVDPEPVIICRQSVQASVARSFLGWNWWGHKTAFVAGYSDGTIEFLSPAQFKKLDLSGFAPLSSLGVEGFHVRFEEQSPKE